jgi:predicted ribonuclease YlaK
MPKKNKSKDDVKNFFIDTNVLMTNPLKIFNLLSVDLPTEIYDNLMTTAYSGFVKNFERDKKNNNPNNVYISNIVEWELNNIKDTSYKDEIAKYQARFALKVLTELRKYGFSRKQKIKEGIELPNKSKIFLVNHKNNEFNKNKSIYEPNRDDEIVFDYIGKIDELHKEKTGQVFEVITEDDNFQAKIIDSISDLGFEVNCRPLMSERTINPNPAEQYTGLHKNPILIPKNTFMELSNLNEPITRDQLKSYQKKSKSSDIDLDNIIQNEFVKVTYKNNFADSEILLRRRFDQFTKLEFYNESLLTSKIIEAKNEPNKYQIFKDELNNANTKEEFREIFLRNSLQLKNNDIKKWRNKISSAKRELDFNKVKSDVLSYIGSLKSKSKKNEQGAYSRESLINRPFNPDIIPDDKQQMFMELLLDPSVAVVSLITGQGRGKTVLSMMGGFINMRQGVHKRIRYMRPLVPVGEDLGYRKGSVEEKIAPYSQTGENALSALFGLDEEEIFYTTYPSFKVDDPDKIIQEFTKNKIIEYDVMTFIQGKTINNTWIIADEAEYFSKDQLKLLIGRLGKGSKLIILGDYKQQEAGNKDLIRKYELNPRKIGISHLIEGLCLDVDSPNNPDGSMYGHITIQDNKSMRSKAANLEKYIR